MPKVTFMDHAGIPRTVDVDAGTSLMRAAVRNNVPGIDAECGGQMSCATCHVLVVEDWAERVGPASDAELQMLELADDVCDRSRLACQVLVTDDLDGLVVSTPEFQG